MEIEQVAELARAVAALPQAEKDFFDGLVADERAKSAQAERIAKLRGMSDIEIVRKVLEECTDYAQSYGSGAALEMLREAGFVRNDDDPAQPFTHTQAEVDEICRLGDQVTKGRVAEFVQAGGYLEQAYRAGFEASSKGWNFQIKSQAVFEHEDFQSRMECDLDGLRDEIRRDGIVEIVKS